MIGIIDWGSPKHYIFEEFNFEEDYPKLKTMVDVVLQQKKDEIRYNKKGFKKDERKAIASTMPWLDLRINSSFEIEHYNFFEITQNMINFCQQHVDDKKHRDKFPGYASTTLEGLMEKLESIDRIKKSDLKTSSSKENLLEKLGITEECAQYLSRIDDAIHKLKHLEGNYSALDVFSHAGEVIKADILDKARKEQGFLALDLGESRKFLGYAIADLVYEIEDIGFFRLKDVRNEAHGQLKSGFANEDEHYMYILGLLHKEATRAVKYSNFDLLSEDKLHMCNLDYPDCIELGRSKMIINDSKVRKSEEKNLLKKILSQYKESKDYIVTMADEVIMNDCKACGEGSNIVNGHLVDFGSVKIGLPTEDIVKYAMTKGYNKHQLEGLIQTYGILRSNHDHEFADNLRKRRLLGGSIRHAILKESLRFAASMTKRDLTEPKYLQQRDYYLALAGSI
jgi:hypothetical protein